MQDALPPHLSALVDASSGSLGSLLTTTLLYPLDVAKTRVQSGKAAKSSVPTVLLNLLRQEPGALLRGLGPKAVHAVLQNFLYFYNYSALKSAWKSAGLRVSTMANTLCGVAAGMAGLILTLPLETLVVRMQCAGPEGDLLTECSQLLADGVPQLWRGFSVSSILTLNPAITMSAFDLLKATLLQGRKGAKKQMSTAEAFALASLSKCIATWITYPLIRTKTVMQAQQKAPPPTRQSQDAVKGNAPAGADGRARRGFAQVLVSILREEGAAGLYRGFGAQIVSAVLKSGIQLTCKEALFRYALGLVLLLSGRARARKGIASR
jgi:hypothetical protein